MLAVRLDPRSTSSLRLQAIVYTVIRFVSNKAKFGSCTIVGLNGTLGEAKICTLGTYVRILTSSSVIFRPVMVQMPNLALVETKRITVYVLYRVSRSRPIEKVV
jgi:hypothetical protein